MAAGGDPVAVITDVRQAAGTLLARRDAPTAIITNSDYAALGIYKTARDLSRWIGPDVSVIGHDDLPTSDLLDPPNWLNAPPFRRPGYPLTRCSSGWMRQLGNVP